MLSGHWWPGVVLVSPLALIAIGLAVETAWTPAGRNARPIALNLCVYITNLALSSILLPLTSLLLTPVVVSLGGGFVELPSTGFWLLPAFLLYVVAIDFGEFAFHYAQHRAPLLWAMHSFHHSDPAVNITTGGRHFWFEFVLKAFFIYTPAAILFRVNATISVLYAFLRLLDFVLHANVRCGFGPVAGWISSPQYHRIHHSIERKHWDKNYAPFLSVFDKIFGTQYLPAPDEYPETGLDTKDPPTTLIEALLWPARDSLRRAAARSSAPG